VVSEGRAGSPQLLDTHRLQAFEMQRFVLSDSARAGTRMSPDFDLGGNGVLARTAKSYSSNMRGTAANVVTALRIFRPPIAVTVDHQNGRPSRLTSKKHNQIAGEVLWAAGPWQSSGDWWEQDAWVRDEWDIAVQEKTGITLYRLIHDLLRGQWLLEGCYD
jgi:protein ImuB